MALYSHQGLYFRQIRSDFTLCNVLYVIIDYNRTGWNKEGHGWKVFRDKCKDKGMDLIDANDALELRRYTHSEKIWQKISERRVFWLADRNNPRDEV